jgi:ABC-type transport system substrate-binding protein
MRGARARHREFRDSQRERHRSLHAAEPSAGSGDGAGAVRRLVGRGDHGITEAVFTPIQNSATAVAALLSGEVDLINPVPVQDAERVDANDGTSVIRGIESRVIMLGFAHDHETLRNGAENPFSDVRVRRAVAHAVNVPAILQTIMRGSAEPAAQLVAAGTSGYSDANGERPAYDPDGARALLAEAGYPDGFAFDLSAAPMTAISTTRRCARRLSACWRRWA